MALIPVNFEYRTGLRRAFIVNARLAGSWDAAGRPSANWTTVPMAPFVADDGCPAFRATVQLDDVAIGRELRWGVALDLPSQPDRWGIPTEAGDMASAVRERSFTLRAANQTERFYLTHCRRLGANKVWAPGAPTPALRFAVWAPNAQRVDAVFGSRDSGYIYPDGTGIDAALPQVALTNEGDGVWAADGRAIAALADYPAFDHRPYMFRITKENGTVAFRTDLYSRCQIGSGDIDPSQPEQNARWDRTRASLDGTKSCSVIVDPERVVRPFRQVDATGRPVWPETDLLSEDEFWRDEFDPLRPLPTRLADLVIYELHVDGLGAGRNPRGMLDDALALLPYLSDLGVNAVEVMPLSEYKGFASWGYETSHYFAVEYAGGGRDQFKHFVRACHQRGIAVLMDVVYNHYLPDAERAEWAYDSDAPERNVYYWYEGHPDDYPAYEEAARRDPQATTPRHGGYVDNLSTGYAPRYREEMVRKMFISSAAQLVAEFHVDGFRVDQTTSIHAYPVLHADGRPLEAARIYGARFLREWSRTVRLVNPGVFLIAEDHSGWDAVTRSTDDGGLGFDAVWYADYYHHLVGDAQNDASRARLLKYAGYGDDRPLNVTWFAGALAAGGRSRVVYHESHDEAGNSRYEDNGRTVHSARTIMVAVDGAPLFGPTRAYAEARARVVAAITLLGPGVPMFFMGEEVGASEPYRFDDFLAHREDFAALRNRTGGPMFACYRDLIRLRREHAALRSANIDVVHVHNENRVLAFRRWDVGEDLLVVATLANAGYPGGYRLTGTSLPDGRWRELLNTDAGAYGGGGVGNPSELDSAGGSIAPRLPGNGVLVLQRQ